MRGLLDTSVFIAREHGRELQAERLPEEVAVSVVTLAELELGVQMADSETIRAERMATLGSVRATYAALPIDESIASAFAELVATARRDGRRPKVQDTWIAATARVHDVAVYTQDDDFEGLAGVAVVKV